MGVGGLSRWFTKIRLGIIIIIIIIIQRVNPNQIQRRAGWNDQGEEVTYHERQTGV